MKNLKINADVAIDNSRVFTQDPGIYDVSIVGIQYGEKTQKDKEPEPCVDIILQINSVIQLHKADLDPNKPVGKPITDRTKFTVDGALVATQEDFDAKIGRVMHVLTKGGISKDAIAKVKFEDVRTLAEGLNKLVTDEVKKTRFCYKVVGSVYNSNPISQAVSYNEAAAPLSEGMRFSPKEIANNNAYYAKLQTSTPSTEGDAGGEPAAGDKPASKQLF